jgi:hypothetical protein
MKQEKQGRVLEHLQVGRSITVGECYHLYRTHDLRRIISRLRGEGHVIVSEYETSPDGTETYKRYRMGGNEQMRMAL